MSDDAPAPIPLRLSCPACGVWHIDEGDLATTPHRTHACQNCGTLWAPAVVPTVGVKFLPGCKNEVTPEPAETRAATAVTVGGHDPACVTLTWSVYLAMRERLARLEAAQTGAASPGAAPRCGECGCATHLTLRCICTPCDRQRDVPEALFFSCATHREEVDASHQRIRGRPAEWVPFEWAPA